MWDKFSTYLFIDQKLDDGKHNIEVYHSRFSVIERWFRGKVFNRDNFNAFIKERKEAGAAPSTLNNYIKVAKHIDRFLGIEELKDYSFFSEQKGDKIPLTPQEIQSIIDTPYPYERQVAIKRRRNRVAIEFLFATGCRISELQELLWHDVRNSPIPYVIFRDTKNGKDHELAITQRMYDLLLTMPRNGDRVFENEHHKILDRKTFTEVLQWKAKKAGIDKPVYPHIFRHSRGTYLWQLGYSDGQIAKFLNHSSIESTKIYTHPTLEDTAPMAYASPLEDKKSSVPVFVQLILDFGYRLLSKREWEITVTVQPKLDILHDL